MGQGKHGRSIPVRERLGFVASRTRVREGTPDRGLMARALMYLFLAGASISVFAISFTESPDAHGRMLVIAVAGYLVALLLLVGYDSLPGWSFPVLLACATMLIEWTIYAGGETGSVFATFYFWVAIYAFYFFSRTQAIGQLLLIAAAYAAVLQFSHDATGEPMLRWGVTTSALVVAGAMIGLLKERVDRLLAALAGLSRTDPHTGLLNRRAFQEELSLEVERSRRHKTHMALLVGELRAAPGQDLDAAMERAAAAIRVSVRRIDRAARMGETRIAVIAGGSNDHGGYILAERLQQAVQAAGRPGAAAVSMHFGVASLPAHAEEPEQLVAAATAALDEAQLEERQRVVTYLPQAAPETHALA